MWRHRLFFSVLYFIQGAALAYIINFQKPYLNGEGVSKEAIGIFTSLLLLPFIAKVGLGWLSDRLPFGSRAKRGVRKPYMIMGLGLFAICYLAISFLQPGDEFFTFAVLTWFASLGLALFDTCADAWAIDCASPSEQGAIQASMIAGKSLGLLTMAFLFGQMVDFWGFAAVFKTLASLAIVVLLVVIFVPYKKVQSEDEPLLKSWRELTQGFYIAFALFGVTYSVASFGTDGLLSLYLSEVKGDSVAALGNFGVVRGVGALAGAALYVLIGRQLGLLKTQYLAVIFLIMGCLLPLLSLPSLLIGLGWGMCWGFQETAYVTLAMRFARGAWAASFFAIAMIFSNLGTSLGEILGAPLISKIGYSGVFMGFALVASLSLFFVPIAFSRIRAQSDR